MSEIWTPGGKGSDSTLWTPEGERPISDKPEGQGETQSQAKAPRPPVPPATFEGLVGSFRFHAELCMGVYAVPDPETGGAAEPDFEMARHAIDMLGMLQEKTRGNLTLDEQRSLENTLTELRFRYVQRFEESQKKD